MAELTATLVHLVLTALTLVRTTDLPANVALVFAAHAALIVLSIVHGESNYEIALILSIYH